MVPFYGNGEEFKHFRALAFPFGTFAFSGVLSPYSAKGRTAGLETKKGPAAPRRNRPRGKPAVPPPAAAAVSLRGFDEELGMTTAALVESGGHGVTSLSSTTASGSQRYALAELRSGL
jgi:hypothetical protein